MRESRIYSIKPRIDSGFARVNLLSATDEANNHCPFVMAVHARDQEFRFRIREPRAIFSSFHETCGLLQIPRTLRLVEYHNVFWWGI